MFVEILYSTKTFYEKCLQVIFASTIIEILSIHTPLCNVLSWNPNHIHSNCFHLLHIYKRFSLSFPSHTRKRLHRRHRAGWVPQRVRLQCQCNRSGTRGKGLVVYSASYPRSATFGWERERGIFRWIRKRCSRGAKEQSSSWSFAFQVGFISEGIQS